MQAIITIYDSIAVKLKNANDYLWPLLLRVILFWEFFEAGKEKYNGNNWFSGIQENFPIPFSWLSADVNWLAATWGELILSVMLLLGIFTRFSALSLIVITSVATAAVHWPESYSSLSELWNGYAITNKGAGNFKLPLLFILLLLPLVFNGGGKLSIDTLLLKLFKRESSQINNSKIIPNLSVIALIGALTLIWVLPKTGISLAVLAVLLFFIGRRKST